MRTLKTVVIVFVLFTVFLCCSKKHDNSLRIINHLPAVLSNTEFGDVKFGDAIPYEYSEYLSINEGEFKLTGTYLGQSSSSELILINGPYTHKWTLSILSTTKVKLTEDQ